MLGDLLGDLLGDFSSTRRGGESSALLYSTTRRILKTLRSLDKQPENNDDKNNELQAGVNSQLRTGSEQSEARQPLLRDKLENHYGKPIHDHRLDTVVAHRASPS